MFTFNGEFDDGAARLFHRNDWRWNQAETERMNEEDPDRLRDKPLNPVYVQGLPKNNPFSF